MSNRNSTVAGRGQATFELDAWGVHLYGIQNIDGRTMQQTSAGQTAAPLRNGTRYTALVQVRQGRVTGLLDGKVVDRYEGDGSNLSVLDLWRLPNTRALGVGAYESATTFHCIRIRAIEG